MISDEAINAQIKPILEKMVEGVKNISTPNSRTPAQVQANFAAGQKQWNEDPPMIMAVENKSIPGPFGPIPVRHYKPSGDSGLRPVFVFFHGGGWIAGNIDTHDYLTRTLANKSGVDIISVDYRLAPDYHFPETIDECQTAVKWIREKGQSWNLNPEKIAVGGDSAGGNLSLAVALRLRNNGENWLRFLILFYAALNPERTSESHRLFGGVEYGSTPALYEWFWNSYLPDKEMWKDPIAAPLLSDMKGLPPMFIGIADHDPLRDDSLMLCQMLEASGVTFESRIYPGTVHGFVQFLRTVDISKEAAKEAAVALKKALHILE